MYNETEGPPDQLACLLSSMPICRRRVCLSPVHSIFLYPNVGRGDSGSLEVPSYVPKVMYLPRPMGMWDPIHPFPDRPPWFPSKKEKPAPLTSQNLPSYSYAPAPAVGLVGSLGITRTGSEWVLAGGPVVRAV